MMSFGAWRRGWQRNLSAFVCGALATLTLAPFFIFPFIIPAFAGLYWLVSRAPTHRRAFWDGWWWGWGFYITGLYWFCIALLTDPDKFAWLIPFALFGLTAVIAIYNGIACYLFSRIRARGLAGIVAFSVVWTVVEYARGHVFTGFPWNLEGYSFGFSDASLQMASLVGAYGLTWFAVLLGVSFAALTEKRGRIFLLACWGVFAAGMWWGAARLDEANAIPQADRRVPGVSLRLVQANISQPHKWDPKLEAEGLRLYAQLTQLPGLEKATHVIWPETAVPYAVAPGKAITDVLGNVIPPGKILITGSLRTEGPEDDFQIWNSMVAVAHGGKIVGAYDKVKLVPFGEFLPLRWLLPDSWLTPVGEKDFSRGGSMTALAWPGLPPIYPLICYEAIFPDLPFRSGTRPQLLLNITNDAWFGMSSGPYQHFQMARMRAVEQGIPLVRVANTGITAVIDSYGQVVASLPLGVQGVLDVALPRAQKSDTVFNLLLQLGYNFFTIGNDIVKYMSTNS